MDVSPRLLTRWAALPALLAIALGIVVAGWAPGRPAPGSVAALGPGHPVERIVTARERRGASIIAVPARSGGQSSASTVTINWTAPGTSFAEVRLSVDSGAEKVFGQGSPAGSESAPFIGVGHRYVFRLYASPAAHRPLASVVVEDN